MRALLRGWYKVAHNFITEKKKPKQKYNQINTMNTAAGQAPMGP